MRSVRVLAVGCGLAALLWAQQFKFNLDHLAAKASDSVDLSLNKDMIQFAGKFLNSKNSDEAKAKEMIGGLEGIYIKSFEFDKDGQWNQADLDQIRNQLKTPEWNRIVGVKSSQDQENAEVWVRTESGKISGLAVLAAEPRELTVVNIVGNISLESLAALGGQMGIPKLQLQSPPSKKKEP
jgi:hypothetical protein